ncbi:unnamed protein product, partial [Mesorhabditis spiculigera]
MELFIPFIYFGIVIVFVGVGCFGNLNVIWATLRKKELRGKHGTLLFIVVCLHTACLFFEFLTMGFNLLFVETGFKQLECAQITAVYFFALTVQNVMALVIVLDLLIAISLPIKHRIWSIRIYIPLVCLPAVIIGCIFTSFAAIEGDPESIVLACTPLVSLEATVEKCWLWWNLAVNLAILVLYGVITIIITMKAKEIAKKAVTQNACVMRKKTDEQKVLASLSLLISVFEFSWCSYIICHIILSHTGLSKTPEAPLVQMFLSIFSLVCFSQSYYVCRIRSVEYRKAFKDQIKILLCQKKKAKAKCKQEKAEKAEKETVPTTSGSNFRARAASVGVVAAVKQIASFPRVEST